MAEDGALDYCPACAEMLGFLEYYPAFKPLMQVHFIDRERPRRELIELLGADNQSCPVLILDECPDELPPQVGILQGKGRLFIEGVPRIARYLASIHADVLCAGV